MVTMTLVYLNQVEIQRLELVVFGDKIIFNFQGFEESVFPNIYQHLRTTLTRGY